MRWSHLLSKLERYYDSAPRARSRVEEIGPFTLFVATSGWPYYARPRLDWSRQDRPAGGKARPTAASVDDVRSVLARQRELGVPQAMEWVDETTPGLVDVVLSAGAYIERCPLLVLHGEPVGTDGAARMLEADDRAEIAASQAAIAVSFQHGGTSTGTAGLQARDEQARSGAAADPETLQERLAQGNVRMAAVWEPNAPDAGPVGGGNHIPVDGVTEIVGVGVLPAYRRRGLAGHLTYVLARDALARGVTTVFCSAQSDDVARVYEAVGFRRAGTACIASVEQAH